MADVVFEDPIHHISGKISKKYRTCYNYRKAGGRKYTSVHGATLRNSRRQTPTKSRVRSRSPYWLQRQTYTTSWSWKFNSLQFEYRQSHPFGA